MAPPPFAPAPPAAVGIPGQETKSCPHCSGVILATAKKCKHCGEFLTAELRAGRMSGTVATAGPPMGGGTEGMAIAALVLGIISLFGWCCPVIGVVTSLLALIFGIVARGNIAKNGREGGGMAIAGIVLGSICLLLSIANGALGILMHLSEQGGGAPPF